MKAPAAALRIFVALALALAFLPMGMRGASAAEDGYRYWGYYQWTGGAWNFAQTGAAESVPADGSVEGWRYALAGPNDSKMPRAGGDFEAICADAPAQEGLKRVAVIVDQGTPADAPEGAQPNGEVRGTCVVTEPETTGSDVLSKLAEMRVENGLNCAIDNYPATGCGAEKVTINEPAPPDAPVDLTVTEPSGQVGGFQAPPAPTTAPSQDSNSPWIIGVVLVAFLALAGLFLARRRGSQPQQVSSGSTAVGAAHQDPAHQDTAHQDTAHQNTEHQNTEHQNTEHQNTEHGHFDHKATDGVSESGESPRTESPNAEPGDGKQTPGQ